MSAEQLLEARAVTAVPAFWSVPRGVLGTRAGVGSMAKLHDTSCIEMRYLDRTSQIPAGYGDATPGKGDDDDRSFRFFFFLPPVGVLLFLEAGGS